jgi:uncharacterized protein
MFAQLRPLGLALVGAAMLASPASAQRDPAYQAARSAGLIGEQPDGYLGFVTPPSAEIRRMVEDLNIRRRAAYTERAAAANATVEQFAFTSGCNLINQTVAGEKYMGPDGTWRTRTSAPPVRDSRCI